MKIVKIIVHNFWLKVISLILAIATWFYIFDLINPTTFVRQQETVEDILERYQFTIKEVPVRPVFTGKAPEGYRVAYDKVRITPQAIAVCGPVEVVQGVEELETDSIDLNTLERSTKLKLGVRSEERLLQFKDKEVEIYVPIERVD